MISSKHSTNKSGKIGTISLISSSSNIDAASERSSLQNCLSISLETLSGYCFNAQANAARLYNWSKLILEMS